jgi:hypothetical protein
MPLSASAANGNIDVSSSGDLDLSNESSGMAASVYTTGPVTLNAGGAIVEENGSTVYASTLMLTATGGIGTASSPLETSSPGTLTWTAAGDGLFLVNNMALTVNSATAGNGDLSISSTGNLTLQGNVSSNSSVTLTATDGTLTTIGNPSLSADSLAITAEQIGSTNDVIQASATAINVAANFGGIYLSNNSSGVLTLSAAAVGPTSSTGSTNNIVIYSEGNIVLSPLTTKLTDLATTLPVAVFSPGGNLTLLAGAMLSSDGTPTTENNSATVTSADAGDDPATYYDVWTGTYDINGFINDNFSSSSSGGLDSDWTVQSGTFTVNTASQTATATDTSGTNLATVNGNGSVNESVSATLGGTLASGQDAGLVALFTSVNSVNSYYYGSITAASGCSYTANIYSVVSGGNPLPLLLNP